MLKSMTGYGKISEVVNQKKITVEIKSLNSKNFNPFIKIPEIYNEKEIEIKNLLFDHLTGGKINFTLNIEDENNTSSVLNKQLINNYYKQIIDIAEEHNLNPENEQLLQTILRFPDILKIQDNKLNEEEWEHVKSMILKAIKEVNRFRKQEGEALDKDIRDKLDKIVIMIPEIEKFEDERIDTISNRLKTKLNDYVLNDDQKNDRFEQEIIYYLDKFDLNEEKTRLANHCKYFSETINTDSSVGPKLGFICQEIGREINTIGSKANHAEIQKIIVDMKDNLGKIKEQLLNVL